MFVQEEKIFAGKVLKVHISTMDGSQWLEEVTEDTTVEKLKEKCLKHVGFWCCLVSLLLPLLVIFCPVTPVPGLFAVYYALYANCQCRCHWLCIYSHWVDSAIYNSAGWLPPLQPA